MAGIWGLRFYWIGPLNYLCYQIVYIRHAWLAVSSDWDILFIYSAEEVYRWCLNE